MTEQHVTVPAAPVTLLDIYTRQVEMAGQLALIHERLSAIPDHEARIRTIEAALPDQASARLSALEAWRWKLAGVVLVLTIGGGYAGYLIGHMH